LSSSESRLLSELTLVGMRFYDGSYDSLIRSARQPVKSHRLMFLVPEVDNKQDVNAVMLSNGRQKIASIAAAEAPMLKALFERWRREKGYDEVIVVDFVCTPSVETQWEVNSFKRLGSIKVKGLYRVHERLARKFAAK